MRNLLLIPLLLFVGCATAAPKPAVDTIAKPGSVAGLRLNSGQLAALCAAPEATASNLCIGYLVAVADISTLAAGHRLYCGEGNVLTPNELGNAYLEWYSEHKLFVEMPAALTVPHALVPFRCKQ